MSLRLCYAAWMMLAVTNAQDIAKPKLNLQGDGFHGLTYDEMTPAQKTLADRSPDEARPPHPSAVEPRRSA